ncbi:RNA polymerase sigma factor [Spirosoma areae]
MNPNLKDEEVIRQYLTTNPNDCFETLYNRYVRKVYSRCLSLTKDAEQAHDFTHDIFIRMFARLDRFEERSSFSTWLYSISHNYCLDQIRIGNRLTTTPLEGEAGQELQHPYVTSDEGEESEQSLQLLANVMKAISPEEAAILRLKYQEGLDIGQIAERLNIKDSAVKMRLKRSRDKVRQLYGQSAYLL